MNVTLADVLAGAEVRAVPLSAECVGYLVLAAADQICGAPRRVAAGDVLLFEDGGVRVASARASEGAVAESDLRSVLDALLLRSSAPTGGLLRASRRAPGAGLEALVRELETALIPVNRSAAKRALARLERETVRALSSGRIRPSSAPPAEPQASAAPPPVAASPSAVAAPVEAPEPSVALPAVAAPVEAPEPSVALPAVAPALSPYAPVVLETVALPVAAATSDAFEPQDRTVVLAPVAPRESADSTLVETRPEPVVVLASSRPPAAPVALEASVAEPVRTEPLPPVAPLPPAVPVSFAVAAQPSLVLPAEVVAAMAPPEPRIDETVESFVMVTMEPSPPPVDVAPECAPAVTPVLGTRMFETRVPAFETAPPVLETAPPVLETAPPVLETAPPVLETPPPVLETPPPVLEAASSPAEDDELEIVEVLFGQEELTILPSDDELIYAEGGDWTEPSPPIAAESMLPPPALEVASADEEPVQLSEEQSALPPWAGFAPPELEVTPPPRVALPEPRPSDVDDLLLELADAPLAVDELRSGLRRLAGMEPTPPPPGTWRGD